MRYHVTGTPEVSKHEHVIIADDEDVEDEMEDELSEETTSKKANSSFERFCKCTSLHGWRYLSTSVNPALRAGWVAVVLCSIGVASFFLGYSCNDFLSSTVQTTQDTSR